MPRYQDGAQDRLSRGWGFLRALGFALAVALGVFAVWLIVTSTEQKRIEIGILAGLWGLLLGAFAIFGIRRSHAAQPARAADQSGTEIELRRSAELERAAEAAARREHEQRLEQMLRQEIAHTITAQVADLRAQITALRNELVEKVDSHLRLEYTETTRIIGSDIEALQREVSQLKSSRQRGDLRRAVAAGASATRVVEAAPGQRADAAEPVSSAPAAPEHPTVEQPRVEQPTAEQPSAGPVAPLDGFAGLPRITPFTAFELDPIDPPSAGRHGGPPPAAEPAAPDARADDDAAESSGRHSQSWGPPGSGGGRRRRESDEDNDTLARVLRREASASR